MADGNMPMSSDKCRGCTRVEHFELHLITTVNLQYRETGKMLEKKIQE